MQDIRKFSVKKIIVVKYNRDWTLDLVIIKNYISNCVTITVLTYLIEFNI